MANVYIEDVEGGEATTLSATDMIEIDTGAQSKFISGENLASSVLDLLPSGWQEVSETWTRTGNHTFTVSTDLTAKYRKGAFVRYKDGGAYEYGVVQSSTYSAPNTTVTLIVNTDYTMAAATITDTYISYIPNPEGWVGAFNWTPTRVGFSANPTNTLYQWRSMGANFLMLTISEEVAGTSNADTNTISLPVTAKTVTYIGWNAVASAVDNGAPLTNPAWAFIASGATVVAFYVNWAGSAWKTSAGKRINKCAIMYEF